MFYKFMFFTLLGWTLTSCAEKSPLGEQKTHLSGANDTIGSIANRLDSLGEAGEFHGAIAIAKDGALVLEWAYGLANLDHQVPNTQETKFAFASMGKMFTGIAIMQLVEKGILEVEEKVGTYLPSYPSAEVREKVTLHHLLTHTSGLPDFMTDDYMEAPKQDFRKVADYTPYFEDEPLEFEPGSQFIYRNSDYVVLGLIIEKVTGTSYFEYVEANILEPAQMHATGYPAWDHPEPNRATGYTASNYQPGQLMANTYLVSAVGGPFGGGCGTTLDFLAFARSLRSYQLLSSGATTQMMAGQAADSTYGYGFADQTINGHRISGHSGGHYGISAELRMFSDLGYDVVVMTNRDAEAGFLDARYIIEEELVGKTEGQSRYFYSKRLVETIRTEGVEAGLQSLGQSTVLPSGIALNQAGFHALDANDFDLAKAYFTVYQTAHPEAADAWDCMGEAHAKAGEKEKAQLSFQKALKLDPSDPYAKRRLVELREN